MQNYIFSRLLQTFWGSNFKDHFSHVILLKFPKILKHIFKKDILIFVLYYYRTDKYKSILDHYLAEYKQNVMKAEGQFLG